ncbi:MAG: CHAD domain-containing protein, partial [Kiritimatiellae bacterium]|nr:CHAD domain-containing protein [Kiritimatiellia bacterium]
PLVRRYSAADGITRRYLTRYFDTPNGDLYLKRVWLRTRCVDGKWLQTVKAPGRVVAGIHHRKEFEVPIEGEGPDPKALPDDETVAFLDDARLWASLHALIETEFERTRWDLHLEDGTHVELVVDVGEVRAAGRRGDLCEVELELKAGEAISLVRLARELADALHVRLDDISKARRGWMLLNDRKPEPVHAHRVELDPLLSVPALMQSCLSAGFLQVHGNIACILSSEDIEGVHQMRVGMRRFRAAMRAFRKGGLARPACATDVRWILNTLGRARDLDVLLTVGIPGLITKRQDAPSVEALRDRAEAEREIAYASLRTALRSPRCQKLMLDLLLWIQEGTLGVPDEDLVDFSRRILRRGHQRVCRAGESIVELSDHALHDLRIDIKRQRYCAELLASLSEKSPRAYLKSLKRLQSVMGAIQDATMAPATVGALVSDEDPLNDFVQNWSENVSRELRPTLVPLWQAFRQTEPFWLD